MKISEIPKEVYEVALAYEQIESWDVEKARETYHIQKADGNTSDGLEKALKDYLAREGDFSGNGRFGEVELTIHIED